MGQRFKIGELVRVANLGAGLLKEVCNNNDIYEGGVYLLEHSYGLDNKFYYQINGIYLTQERLEKLPPSDLGDWI